MSFQTFAIARRPRFGLRFRAAVAAYLCLTPWLIGFVVFMLGPMVASLGLSLTRYSIVEPPKWIGIANFREMFAGEDPLFWHSLRVTFIYTFVSVPMHVVLGYGLALLLNQKVRGLSILRTIYYTPSVVPAVATAYLFAWVFHADFGLMNTALAYLGITGPKWLNSTQWALPTFVLISNWGVGGSLVLYLAAMQGVPTQLYEAAMIDGAGRWARLVNVTIPMTSPVIFFTMLTGMIGTFQVFTTAYLITGGGPAEATHFYVLHLYNNAFRYFQMGYASALAWILFVIIMVFTLLLVYLSGRLVYYEGEQRRV